MQAILRLFFIVNVVLLVMLGFAFPFVEPGSATYVVSILSLVVLIPAIVLSGLAIRYKWTLPWMGPDDER